MVLFYRFLQGLAIDKGAKRIQSFTRFFSRFHLSRTFDFPLGIYHILPFSFQEGPDISGGDLNDPASGLHGGPGHVGGDDAVFGGIMLIFIGTKTLLEHLLG